MQDVHDEITDERIIAEFDAGLAAGGRLEASIVKHVDALVTGATTKPIQLHGLWATGRYVRIWGVILHHLAPDHDWTWDKPEPYQAFGTWTPTPREA